MRSCDGGGNLDFVHGLLGTLHDVGPLLIAYSSRNRVGIMQILRSGWLLRNCLHCARLAIGNIG